MKNRYGKYFNKRSKLFDLEKKLKTNIQV